MQGTVLNVSCSANYQLGEGKSWAPAFHLRWLGQVQWETPQVNVPELLAMEAPARGSFWGGWQGCWQGNLGLEGTPTTSKLENVSLLRGSQGPQRRSQMLLPKGLCFHGAQTWRGWYFLGWGFWGWSRTHGTAEGDTECHILFTT